MTAVVFLLCRSNHRATLIIAEHSAKQFIERFRDGATHFDADSVEGGL
jgi:hypothetical protein